ncbi:transmembrane protein [Klebsiella grimontii]|uniref:Transmembrane protein n=1 Tax=Klebsiella grimontii TaxID=2058152 RepID=A0A7H4P960_9ENTR|nr:transmembrane protein [Klebsiella grimontii]
MLAWGNRAAQKADVALDMLIPPSLRKTQAVNDLPLAVAQEDVTLGGEARLTATTAYRAAEQLENAAGMGSADIWRRCAGADGVAHLA